MIKLFYMPSACSLSPHIALREADLPFNLVRVDRSKKTASGDDFLAVNPKGQVPALEIEPGKVLTEGPAIVQYIADQKPASKLAPPNGTFERARVQEWLNYVSTELHKGFSPLFGSAYSDDAKAVVTTALTKKFEFLDAHLGKHQYLANDTFSVADPYLFTVLRWAAMVKIDLSPWKNLVAFQERIGARPAVKAALEAEAAKA